MADCNSNRGSLFFIGWARNAVGVHILKQYQRDRLTNFIRPEADSQGSGYQVMQSIIAVGSGGIWGSSSGTQTHLAFLPVPQTDFIFAAFAENMDS